MFVAATRMFPLVFICQKMRAEDAVLNANFNLGMRLKRPGPVKHTHVMFASRFFRVGCHSGFNSRFP